ncbi:RNA recognition motif domain-containing protein [Haloferula sp.]|uniref:RNA recognition motif domain-containing protein n=1 Tax=Haloferula sp. TaxID=2497595 RepID=UPI00329EC1BE
MSNETSESQGSDGQRRRSRGGRNRNRNRRNNQDGSPRNDNREGGRGGNREGSRDGNREGGRGQRSGNRSGSRSGGRNRNREHRKPKPVPLTWWQKLLKSIGLYKEPVRPPRREKKEAPKSNTRVAKGGDSDSGESKPRGERKPRKPRNDNEEHRERRPPENVVVESNRLYLGNLSYEATENDFEELFKGIGNVRRVEIVYNRQTHRSKGYGFIDMMNKDEARRAVEVLHDQFFMGRRLVVNGAKSQGPAEGEEENDTPTPEPKAEVVEDAPQITIEEAPEPAEENKA